MCTFNFQEPLIFLGPFPVNNFSAVTPLFPNTLICFPFTALVNVIVNETGVSYISEMIKLLIRRLNETDL